MPELQEVESVRLQLLGKIVGKKITDVVVLHPKSTNHHPNFASLLVGKKIAHIDRVGKLMIFSFVKEPDFFLLGHLKMTGQFKKKSGSLTKLKIISFPTRSMIFS